MQLANGSRAAPSPVPARTLRAGAAGAFALKEMIFWETDYRPKHLLSDPSRFAADREATRSVRESREAPVAAGQGEMVDG